jgi:hypothetical protein
MKKLLVLAVVAGFVAPAFAGGCKSSCGGGANSAGYDCLNQCPLAQDANTRRSSGREAFATSAGVRSRLGAALQRNLARV